MWHKASNRASALPNGQLLLMAFESVDDTKKFFTTQGHSVAGIVPPNSLLVYRTHQVSDEPPLRGAEAADHAQQVEASHEHRSHFVRLHEQHKVHIASLDSAAYVQGLATAGSSQPVKGARRAGAVAEGTAMAFKHLRSSAHARARVYPAFIGAEDQAAGPASRSRWDATVSVELAPTLVLHARKYQHVRAQIERDLFTVLSEAGCHSARLPRQVPALSWTDRASEPFAKGTAWQQHVPHLRLDLSLRRACEDYSAAAEQRRRLLHDLASAAAAHEETMHVSARPGTVSKNLFAAAALQDGRLDDAVAKSPTTEYHSAGIRGESEVVGVADTGIDFDMCFFRDADQPLIPNVPNYRNRKIVEYQVQPDTDERDRYGGHGTHVVGTVAGWSQGKDSSMNGMAPRARIHFLDLENSSVAQLHTPSDLYSTMLSPAYANGARTHSNSWGSPIPPLRQVPAYIATYGEREKDIDDFTHDNPDMLVLAAAGNDGDVYSSTAAPAVAKNILSVGATSSTNQAWMFDTNTDTVRNAALAAMSWPAGATASEEELKQYLSTRTLAYFSSKGPTIDGRFKPDLLAPGHQILSAKSDGVIGSDNCGTATMVRVEGALAP